MANRFHLLCQLTSSAIDCPEHLPMQLVNCKGTTSKRAAIDYWCLAWARYGNLMAPHINLQSESKNSDSMICKQSSFPPQYSLVWESFLLWKQAIFSIPLSSTSNFLGPREELQIIPQYYSPKVSLQHFLTSCSIFEKIK